MFMRRQTLFTPRRETARGHVRRLGLTRLSLMLLTTALAPLIDGMGAGAKAAREADLATEAPFAATVTEENLQLVVLEVANCVYCSLFRRYIVPAYATSPKAHSLPMKFIDMNDKAYDELGLDGPVDTVPTTVLLHNNREIGRIPGYLGPENFFHAVNHLMTRVN